VLKKSFVNISLVSAGHILNAVLGFFFIIVIAKKLSLNDFGKYAMLTSLLIAMAKLTDFGTNSLYIAKSISQNKINLLQKFYSLKIILFMAASSISIGILNLLGLSSLLLIAIFLFGLFAYAVNFTLYTLFQKEEKFIMLILLNTIIATIKGVFAIIILTGLLRPTLLNTFSIFCFSVFASLLLILFLPKKTRIFRPAFTGMFSYLKQAYPAGISQMIYEGWPAIKNTVAKLAQGFSNVGIFSLADKISSIFRLIAISVFTVLLPKNARRKKEKLHYDLKESLLISVGIIFLAVIAAFISGFLVTGFFGTKFHDSIGLLYILIFASAFTSIGTFFENYFFVEEKINYLLKLSVGKLIIFLVFCAVSVPTYSLTGLAVSYLVASLLVLGAISVIIIRGSKSNNGVKYL